MGFFEGGIKGDVKGVGKGGEKPLASFNCWDCLRKSHDARDYFGAINQAFLEVRASSGGGLYSSGGSSATNFFKKASLPVEYNATA